MLSLDRDLLAAEPGLIREAGWGGQRRLRGVGSVSGTTLTLTSGSLTGAGVVAGMVAVVTAAGGGAGSVVEVTGVSGATSASVSRVRAVGSGVVIAPDAAGAGSVVEVWGFEWARRRARDQAWRALGLDVIMSDGGAAPDAAVLNVEEYVEYEVALALHGLLSGASAREGDALDRRGRYWLERGRALRGALVVRLDLDGDGVEDGVVRGAIGELRRA